MKECRITLDYSQQGQNNHFQKVIQLLRCLEFWWFQPQHQYNAPKVGKGIKY